MKIILCGYHWAGCKTLDLLLERGDQVYVFTHEAPSHVPSLQDYCRKRGVPFSLNNVSKSKLPFAPDVISSVYYRNIISQKVIDTCNGKIFNLHPSLLPKYRGCSSLTWSIVNGESESGFTYHYIDAGCDTGNIILQKKIKIEDYDTQLTLFNRVMFDGMESYLEALDMVENGFLGTPQVGEASYHRRGCPFNGEIDPSWDEVRIERFIRAMIAPPYPPATFKGIAVETFEAYSRIRNSFELE